MSCVISFLLCDKNEKVVCVCARARVCVCVAIYVVNVSVHTLLCRLIACVQLMVPLRTFEELLHWDLEKLPIQNIRHVYQEYIMV